VVECRLIDDMLGNEFLSCFPLGSDPLISVSINVHRFKRTLANIVYCPFSDIHKEEIKKKLHNIISLTPKCPFLCSLRTHIMLTISLLTS
jgi:hypothetical protein